MTQAKNLTGLVFGRLTVLRLEGGGKRRAWACSCECGNTAVVAQKELVRGDTKSCGCLRREQIASRNRVGKVDHSCLTHDEKRAYKKWQSMLVRVRHPERKSACYREVSVCKEWEDFRQFLADMGVPPEGHSLDRIDNSRGYCPSNCRWVPLSHQAKNTSRSGFVEFGGKMAIVSDHAREVGLVPDLVFDRINKLGWDIDKALSTPVMRSRSPKRKAKRNQPERCG